MKEAKEAAYDLFTNVTKQLIDEAPRRSQELCLVRKVNKHFINKTKIIAEAAI